MNVAEYIELLKTFPQDLEVVQEQIDNDGCGTGWYDPACEPGLFESDFVWGGGIVYSWDKGSKEMKMPDNEKWQAVRIG